MRNVKNLQKILIERFAEQRDGDGQASVPERHARHLRQFLKMAEHRKQQILEKMLMEENP